MFSKDLCPNQITGAGRWSYSRHFCFTYIRFSQIRSLSEVASNFPTGLEEIVFTAQPDKLRLRNYAEDYDGLLDHLLVPCRNSCTPLDSRTSSTEVILHPQEFEDYRIGVDTSVTFCLKELRVSCGQ